MTDGLSASDVALLQGNRDGNGDGMWGGNGAWWIVLFLIFGWGRNGFGFGGGSGSATDGYILTSDFANIERKIDSVNTGMCDGFYTQAQLINGVNTNILTQGNANNVAMMQGFNGLQTGIRRLLLPEPLRCTAECKRYQRMRFRVASARRTIITLTTQEILSKVRTQEPVQSLKQSRLTRLRLLISVLLSRISRSTPCSLRHLRAHRTSILLTS